MIINSFSYRVCYKFPPSLEFAMEVLNVYVFKSMHLSFILPAFDIFLRNNFPILTLCKHSLIIFQVYLLIFTFKFIIHLEFILG